MPRLLLIELPDDFNEAIVSSCADGLLELLADGSLVHVDPSVYVVPGELSDEPAVFVREEDAEAYSDTYDPPRGVFRLLVCDATVAAEMVSSRADEDDESIDWTGVHWSHDEGAPIECVDDEEGERFGRDDMVAALYVAGNGYPWLLYEEGNDADGQRMPWQVSAFKTKDSALSESGLDGVEYPSGTYAFVFDGRLGIDQIRTNAPVGYRPRRGADVFEKFESEGL